MKPHEGLTNSMNWFVSAGRAKRRQRGKHPSARKSNEQRSRRRAEKADRTWRKQNKKTKPKKKAKKKQCEHCKKYFSGMGIGTHRKFCNKKNKTNNKDA